MNYWIRIQDWAKSLKRDIAALWIAARDRRTPFSAKLMAAGVVSYALSPIDLIPDFIPVLGYLDDIIIVPLGVWIVVKLVPEALMDEFRLSASHSERLPKSWVGLAVIFVIWMLSAITLWRWLQ